MIGSWISIRNNPCAAWQPLRAPAHRPVPRPVHIQCFPRDRGGSDGCPPGSRPREFALSWASCLLLHPDRNADEEGRAHAHCRLDPDFPPMHFDDAACDRQPKAGATLLLGGGAVGLLELFEDLGLI